MPKKTKANLASKSASRSAPKSRPATHADAELLLHLYDQRRDEKLRKARNFVLFEFIPTSDEEFAALAFNFGSEQQTHFRMVFSYWEQTAALADRGVIHGELFDDFSGEMFFLYAKYTPYHEAYARLTGIPFMRHTAKLIETYPAMQDRYTMMLARMSAARKQTEPEEKTA